MQLTKSQKIQRLRAQIGSEHVKINVAKMNFDTSSTCYGPDSNAARHWLGELTRASNNLKELEIEFAREKGISYNM
jgi:hypothetical protein